jgi:chemotaxis protein CheZ
MSQADSGEIEDLEALFDSIAEQHQVAPAPKADEGHGCTSRTLSGGVMAPVDHGPIKGPEELFDRVGRLTRNLHSALAELGYDKAMEKVADALPDARDRLTYISTLTEAAAERALEAVESALPVQRELSSEAAGLAASWDQVFKGSLTEADFRPLALATHRFLKSLPERTGDTEKKLMDIMMAQDFHDLTGQVIKKIVDLAHMVENELVELLVSAHPEERNSEACEEVLSGPVIRTEGRSDIVTNQAQVDELLGQLGF